MRGSKVYCARPISGETWETVVDYYNGIKTKLETLGFQVLQPMTGKSCIRTELTERFKPADHKAVLASNHAIFERDQWMVRNCDILYLDLTGAQRVSIGSMMELAWASLLGKYTIVVMESDNDNIHRHAFVLEAADVIFSSADEALAYLAVFADQKI